MRITKAYVYARVERINKLGYPVKFSAESQNGRVVLFRVLNNGSQTSLVTGTPNDVLTYIDGIETGFFFCEPATDTMREALNGVIHHNNAVKAEYKLPASLIRQVENAIGKGVL